MKKNGFTLIELMIVLAILGIIASIVIGSGGGSIYGYMKSKQITGELVSVTSAVPENGVIVGNTSAVMSSAVMLKVKGGGYVTFSSEDRQWATLRGKEFIGKCITATIYPYAPWNIGKEGTYYNGRLIKVDNSCTN